MGLPLSHQQDPLFCRLESKSLQTPEYQKLHNYLYASDASRAELCVPNALKIVWIPAILYGIDHFIWMYCLINAVSIWWGEKNVSVNCIGCTLSSLMRPINSFLAFLILQLQQRIQSLVIESLASRHARVLHSQAPTIVIYTYGGAQNWRKPRCWVYAPLHRLQSYQKNAPKTTVCSSRQMQKEKQRRQCTWVPGMPFFVASFRWDKFFYKPVRHTHIGTDRCFSCTSRPLKANYASALSALYSTMSMAYND